jgi:antitoxin component YwqK of YwqJK toxin-antitoxin module
MKKIFILLFLIVSISSCDKLLNPSSEYLIDKTISASSSEQIVESGAEFKMIFPANSLLGELQVKVSQESTVADFNIAGIELGKNIYKINFIGLKNLDAPARIVIGYDKAKIPVGRSVSSCVKVYVFSNGNWNAANTINDETNSELIITISGNLESKNNKISEVFHGNNSEIIIGDGYNNSLEPIVDKEKCDCGWKVDYSLLTKVNDTVEKNIHYINNYGKKHGPSLSWWDSERKKPLMTNCYFEGIEHGLVKAFWSSGSLLGETTFNMGKRTGYYNLYFENGIKSIEGNYINDKKEGLWISKFETGNKSKQGNFRLDLENGIWTFWHQNGNKYEEGKYKDGKRIGKWLCWYESGVNWNISNYLEGLLNGQYFMYWENGNTEMEGFYTNGKKSGIWIYYNSFGTCTRRFNYDTNKEMLCP